MAIRLKRRLDLAVATDLEYRQTIADRSLSVSDATMDAGTVFARKIAPSDNVQVDQGEIATIKVLRVEYDGALLLRIGEDDADAIPLKPMSEGQTGCAHLELLTEGPIFLENESATASVTVSLTMVGDA